MKMFPLVMGPEVVKLKRLQWTGCIGEIVATRNAYRILKTEKEVGG
jgi:hypothetical protein